MYRYSMTWVFDFELFYCIIIFHICNVLHPFRYYDKRDAEDAMDSMDGTIMDGRELRVQLAKYGRPTEPRGRRDRYGYGRRSARGYSRSPRRCASYQYQS